MRKFFLEDIEEKELMNRRYKNVCANLNYIEQFLILTSTITGCISVSPFASLLDIPMEVTSFAIGLTICGVAAGNEKYKWIIKKKKKKYVKTVLLAKSKLNSIEVWIFKALINSNINHDEFALINNVLKEYDDTKEKIKNLKT